MSRGEMTEIHCINCHRPYPLEGVPFRCQNCGGVFDYREPFEFDIDNITEDSGIWRYQQTFCLPPGAPQVTLGEGNTPLVWGDFLGRRVAFKLEYLNPTNSFKDRGSAVLTSFLCAKGVESAVDDSSGNAGASFAAYAARSGIKARIFVPDYASRPKTDQMEVFGAQVIRIMGPRSNAAEAVQRAVQEGAIYASHAYLPHSIAGNATVAYELFNQLDGPPGAVVAPVGQGTLVLGVGRGFQALKRAGLIEKMPRLVGVQALACAPLWAVFKYGGAGLSVVTEGETLAEGVRIKHPLRGDALLNLVQQSEGLFVAVEEEQILPGRDQLARMGFYVEATSGIVWNALEQVLEDLPDPVIVILTGSGLKTP
jgi:threonine synthase